jgi:hypothetical protein
MMQKMVFIFTILLSLFGCDNKESQNRKEKSNSRYEIIQDRLILDGLYVQGNLSGQSAPIGVLFPYGKSGEQPNWSLSQWGSKNVIANAYPIQKEDTIIYENEAKRVFFLKHKDKENISIGLEVFGTNEYIAPREQGEDWVHLLLGQECSNFVQINQVESIIYKIKSKLLFCENKMRSEEYDSNLHTAQITLFLTIQNRTINSPLYGDFFWFGLPLYDYRYVDIPEYGAADLGKNDASNKFISTVASNSLFSTSMHTKDWIEIDKDIFPHIKNSFELAKERGFMSGTDWNDLYITSMNLGWEVPGTFDCGIIFECPSLVVNFEK